MSFYLYLPDENTCQRKRCLLTCCTYFLTLAVFTRCAAVFVLFFYRFPLCMLIYHVVCLYLLSRLLKVLILHIVLSLEPAAL